MLAMTHPVNNCLLMSMKMFRLFPQKLFSVSSADGVVDFLN